MAGHGSTTPPADAPVAAADAAEPADVATADAAAEAAGAAGADAGDASVRPHAARSASATTLRPDMKTPAADPAERARHAGRIPALDDAPQPRHAERVELVAALDADPAAARLVGHRRGRAAAEERVEHPVARVGRQPDDAQRELLGLLVSYEAGAALARDALEGHVVPHVRERLDQDAPALVLHDLVGEPEDAVASAQHQVLSALARHAQHAARLAARPIDERPGRPADRLVARLREANHVLGVLDRVALDLRARRRAPDAAPDLGGERREPPALGRIGRVLEPGRVRAVV